MAEHSRDDWQRLGRAIKRARTQQVGYRNTQDWASAVDRSSRVLLGLERGEPVGDETLIRIEQVLGWPTDHAWRVLRGEVAGAPEWSPPPSDSESVEDLSHEDLVRLVRTMAKRVGELEDEVGRIIEASED